MLFIRCPDWKRFAHAARDAKLIVYEAKAVEGLFRVCAVWGQYALIYEETIPPPEVVEEKGRIVDVIVTDKNAEKPVISVAPIEQKLRCGLVYQVILALDRSKEGWITISKINIDGDAVTNFLAEELHVPKDKIIRGSVSQIM
jgi:hypothetical protein